MLQHKRAGVRHEKNRGPRVVASSPSHGLTKVHLLNTDVHYRILAGRPSLARSTLARQGAFISVVRGEGTISISSVVRIFGQSVPNRIRANRRRENRPYPRKHVWITTRGVVW